MLTMTMPDHPAAQPLGAMSPSAPPAGLRAARRDWASSPALREDYSKHRPSIERVISQIASRSGRRLKLRYRGTARNSAWLKHRTAALNLRNPIGQGITRRNGIWVLA
jgi:hypothetical protein